ncbi:MAG: rRNA maturation RNase YbeY [Thermoanaerobaculia bacterium]|nr:rRNA maturation RNase YbeY [Thermoanaerobaculia bacterium]
MRTDVTGRRIHNFPHKSIREYVDRCWSALRRARVAGDADVVSVHFADDREMRRLNRTWRGIDRTTDVLTFPAGDESIPDDAEHSLGDIVISVEQAKRQARQQKHDLATEVRYLILHGLIHALGYDHETDEGEMNALELRIRPRVGLDR